MNKEYLEAAIIDRERRILNLASVIRALTKNGATIPRDCKVDFTLTQDEAKVLGIDNYSKAVEITRRAG